MALPELDVGGAQILTLDLIREIRKKTPEVCFQILVLDAPHGSYLEERCRQEGFDVVYLGKGSGFSPGVIPSVIRAMRAFRPDVVHMHKSRMHYFLLPTLLSGARKRLYTVHNLAEQDTRNKWLRKLLSLSFHRFHVIPIAISDLCCRSLVETYGLQIADIPCIYNGIDLNKFRKPDGCTADRQDIFKVLSVGRLSKQKNYPLLLRAAQKAHLRWPKLQFFILGEGDLRNSIEKQIEEEQAQDYVHLLGNVENVQEYLWDADLFFMTSDYEGLPLTVLEAMAAGLPIVSTKAGGIVDVVEDGKNGYLVDCNDEDALVEAIGKLCSCPARCDSFSKESAVLSNQYSLERMAEKYLEMYLS